MQSTFEAIYEDKEGQIKTSLLLKNKKFILKFDNFEFISDMLDDFSPNIPIENLPKRFMIDQYQCLNEYKLQFSVPLKIIKLQKIQEEIESTLQIRINQKSNPPQQTLQLILDIDQEKKQYKGDGDFFEFALQQIQAQMHENYHLKCCFACAFSDYSVYGQGFWGTMLCYKNNKIKNLTMKA
jgi:hypothetical protein